MKRQQPTEVAGALRAIKRDGDPMDQHRRLGPGVISTLARHPFALMEGLTLGVTAGGHEILADPVVGALGAVGVGMAYGGGLLIDRRRAKRADALQEVVRSALDEPVDIVRSGSKKDRTLTMRWYGADGARGSRELVRRLARLTAAARTYEIPQLAIGTSWLEDVLDPELDIEPYGTLAEGDTWVAERKQSSIITSDEQADDGVLVATPEQLDSLLEKVRSTGDTRLLGELIEMSGDQQLRAAYDQYLAAPADGLGDVIGQAHVHLSRSLDEHIGDEIRIVRGEVGDPKRQRVFQTAHIERRQLNILGQSFDTQTGTRTQAHQATDLLRSCGTETLDELLERCETSEEHEPGYRRHLATAIYLMAYEADERQTLQGATAETAATTQTEGGDTFFERMDREGVPTLLDMVRRRSWTIEYSKRSRVIALLGSVGLFALAGGVGIDGASASLSLLDTVYNQQVAQCEKDLPAYKAIFSSDAPITPIETARQVNDECDAYFARQQPIESGFSTAVSGIEDGEAQLSNQTLMWLYNVLGSDRLHALLGASADWPERNWLASALRDVPPAYYRDAFTQSFIGDTNPALNQTIYNVSSPKGVSSQGYWYGGIFDEIATHDSFSLESSDVPLGPQGDTPDTGFAYVSAPTDAEMQQLNGSAEYVVTSPYVQQGDADLPVHEGMRVAAAVIVDANDSSRVYKPHNVARSQLTGLYSMNLSAEDTDAMWRAGIRTPELKYWLVPDAQPPTHFIGPLQYPALYAPLKNGEAIPSTDDAAMAAARTQLAHDAKAALGLPVTASDAEVLHAIRDSKTYSFTPLADSGKTLDLNYGQHPYEALDQLAKDLEQLHTLNCNLASAAYIFATADSPTQVNEAEGFHDNGDGKLTQGEAHAWLVKADGEKIDPTPGGSGATPTPTKPAANEAVPLLAYGGEALAAMATLGALVIAVRRRRDLLQRSLDLRLNLATRGTHAARAMDVIESSLYGAPAQRQERDWATTLPFSTRDTVSVRLDRIVPRGGLSPEEQQAVGESLANPTLVPGQKRAVKRLLRSTRLIDKKRRI